MRLSPTYKLEQFGDGDVYSAASDYRRFITLDYNLGRYVGLIGDGIVSGWTLSSGGGLTLAISPGQGFISGLFSETPWTQPPIRKSQVNHSTQTIIREIPVWSDPDAASWNGSFFSVGGSPPEAALKLGQLGPDGEADNFGNLTLRPHYVPTDEITFEDPYVEAANNVTLILTDNTDSYIYATRSNLDPQTTFVSFTARTTATPPVNGVLLGIVSVRSGTIRRIDLTQSPRLAGFASVVQALAEGPIATHHHGGSQPFDPPKILLATDVRQTVPWSKDSKGQVTYQILENRLTSTDNSHSHTYSIDTNQNGSTLQVNGTVDFHYHDIVAGIVGSVVAKPGTTITPHTHTIDTSPDPWTDANLVVVYLNDTPLDPTSYKVNLANRQITFNPGVASLTQAAYSSSVKLINGTTFSFEGAYNSPYSFLINMAGEFSKQYQNALSFWDEQGNPIEAVIRSPFDFYTYNGNNAEPGLDGYYLTDPVSVDTLPSGGGNVGREPNPPESFGVVGSGDVLNQSKMAAVVLKNVGDVFTFLPKAARFVDITMTSVNHADTVRVEIMQNSEVTGKLLPGSIAFISADKIATGSFQTTQIPLLGHGGRFSEPFIPLLAKTRTADGISYFITPTWTGVAQGHSHQVFSDRSGNGSTVTTLVGGQPTAVINGNQISHVHALGGFNVESVISNGVNAWQNQVAALTHTHDLELQAAGDSKSIFTVLEDGSDRWMGTSAGLMFVPANYAVQYTFQGKVYRRPANAGLAGLQTALQAHLLQTKNNIVLSNPVAAAAALATITAVDAVATISAGVPDNTTNTTTPVLIAVRGISEFVLDDFSSTQVLRNQEVQPEDDILETFVVPLNDNLSANATYGQCLASADNAKGLDAGLTETVYFTLRSFQNEPCWGLGLVNGQVAVLTPKQVLLRNSDGSWTTPPFPAVFQVSRSMAIDGASTIWVATDTGLFRLPLGAGNFLLAKTGAAKDVFGITVSGSRLILAAADGVWISDDGITWAKTSTVVCRQIQTDGSGHLAALAEQAIYWSDDNGATWALTGATPAGEIGQIYLAAADLFIASDEDVFSSSDHGATWGALQLRQLVRSFSPGGSGFYAGGDNALYQWNGYDLVVQRTFDGSPAAIFQVDDVVQNFWLAWSNTSAGAFFWQTPGVSAQVIGAFTFDYWQSTQGGWPAAAALEVFVNEQTILDTVQGLDRRLTQGPNFVVQAENGRLDFSITTQLSATANAADTHLFVNSTVGFKTGDTLAIYPNATSTDTTKAVIVALTETVGQQASVVTAKVQAVANANTLQLTDPIGVDLSLPTTVKVSSTIAGNLGINANIYDSPLLNAGYFLHPQLEDRLSIASTGSPLAVSNDFLNNLNQLVLRLKQSNSSIDSGLKNWQTYMMRFSNSDSDPAYIEKFFDTIESNLRSGSWLTTILDPRSARFVHTVTIGYGDYAGVVFAGTDIGLFIAPTDKFLKGNWCYLDGCPAGAVYDIVLSSTGQVLVAGANGVYESTADDLSSWDELSAAAITDPTFLTLRWVNFGLPDGALWWRSWDGLKNLVDDSITNTILAGGDNRVAFSNDAGVTWTGSALPLDGDIAFTPTFVQPLSNGSAMLGLNQVGKAKATPASLLLATNDGGDTWPQVVNTFNGFIGQPTKISLTKAGHTQLTFDPAGFPLMPDHVLDGSKLTTDQPWLIVANRNNTIVLEGDVREWFTISTVCNLAAPTLNGLVETPSQHLLLATNNGLLDDQGLTFQNHQIGTVDAVNHSATVTGIDVQGIIDEVTLGVNRTTLTCTLNELVGANELAGRSVKVIGIGAPSLTFTSPTPGSTVSENTVVVAFAAQAFSVSGSGFIALTVDGQAVQYLSTTTTTLTGLNAGTHVLKAQLTDPNHVVLAGTAVTCTFTTTYSSTAPTVSVVYPGNGQAVATPNFVAQFNVANFTLGVNGNLYYSLDGATPILVPQNVNPIPTTLTNLSTGLHTLQARLLNNSSAVVATTSISFSVAAVSQPTIQITSPTSTAPVIVLPTTSLTLGYSVFQFIPGTDGYISVKVDGLAVATSTNPSSLTLANLISGTHLVTLQLCSDSGALINTGATASVTVQINPSLVTTPKLLVIGPTTFTPATLLPVQFSTTNFTLGVDGGLLVSVDGGAAVFWSNSDTYPVPDGSVGAIHVVATLAKDAKTPLSNPEATQSFQITVANILASTAPAPAPAQAPTPAAAVPATTAPAPEVANTASWTVLSNTATALDGSTSIVISGNLPSNAQGLELQIIGANTVLYLNFGQNTPTGSYNQGWVYLGTDAYQVLAQTTNTVVINGKLTDNSPIQVGETVALMPSSGLSTFAANFNQTWGANELRGGLVRILSSQTGSATTDVFPVSNNTRYSLSVGADPSSILPGDPIVMETAPFLPAPTFNNTQTSIDEDHWHEIETVGESIEGQISGLTAIGATMRVTTSALGLSNPILLSHPTLLAGATIIFASAYNPELVYQESVVSVDATHVFVSLANAKHWNLDGSNPGGIDTTFNWSLDAQRYGLTTAIHYIDFMAYTSALTVGAAVGDLTVTVADGSGFVVGDLVRLSDSRPASQQFTILHIASNILTLSAKVSQNFLPNNDAQVTALREGFSGDHVHQIWDSEPTTESVTAYQLAGYNTQHTHGLTHRIQNVSRLAAAWGLGRIVAGGNDSRLLYSDDSSKSWEVLVDTSALTGLDGGVTSLVQSSAGYLMAGLSNGLVVTQGVGTTTTQALQYVPSTDLMPSSSSSSTSSYSSLSSLSTSSQSANSHSSSSSFSTQSQSQSSSV